MLSTNPSEYLEYLDKARTYRGVAQMYRRRGMPRSATMAYLLGIAELIKARLAIAL